MAVHDVLPTENLSVNDIIDTLVANGGELGEGLTSWHDTRSLFNTAASINIASRHKPIIRAVNFCQDFDSTKPNYDEDWWKGADGWCGLSPLKVGNFKLIPQHVDGHNNGWSYFLPNGGESAPMRLGDFAQYYPNARMFISDLILPEKVYKKDVDDILVTFNTAVGNDLQLGVDDFPFSSTPEFGTLAGGYVGVVVENASGSVVGAATAQTLNETSFRIEARNLPEGVITFYPFISGSPITYDVTQGVVADSYTIPMTQPVKVIIEAGSIEIILTAQFMSLYMMSWNAVVFNKAEEEQVLSAAINFYVQEDGEWQPSGAGDSLGDVTIPAYQSITLSGTRNFVFAITETNVHVARATISVGAYKQSATADTSDFA